MVQVVLIPNMVAQECQCPLKEAKVLFILLCRRFLALVLVEMKSFFGWSLFPDR
jgi:hypothetical protein